MYLKKKTFFFDHNEVNIRSLKRYTKERFISLLESTDWFPVYSSKGPDTAWSAFKTTLTTVIDNIAPTKAVRIRPNTNPWITEDILSRISERDHPLATYRKSKIMDTYTQYCHVINELQRDIKCAKSEFFENQINENIVDLVNCGRI